jgi:hypothetical protein
MLELMFPKLVTKITRILERFVGDGRVQLAEESNQLSWLRKHSIIVETEGAIQVFLVTSAVGGTAGILKYVAGFIQWLAGRIGLDVNCSVIMSPPAINDMEGNSKAVRCGARLQELSDLNSNGDLTWRVNSELTIHQSKSPFSHVLLMPEPVSSSNLEKHHQLVADFLMQSILPIGKAFTDESVNMLLDTYLTKGQLGQPQFLAIVGMARLTAAAFPDPEDFAEVQLGEAATNCSAVEAEVEARDVLARHGLSERNLRNLSPKISHPEIPGGINSTNTAVFLTNQNTRIAGEALKNANDAAQTVHKLFEQFDAGLKKILAELCRCSGLQAAVDVLHSVVQLLSQLETAGMAQTASLAEKNIQPRSDMISDRLDSIVEQHQATADRRYWAVVVHSLSECISRTTMMDHQLTEAANIVQEIHIEYSDRVSMYARKIPSPHAVIDKMQLEELIHARMLKCVERTREAALAVLPSAKNGPQFKSAIQAVIKHYAQAFSKLSDIETALRVGGTQARQIFKNFLIAAEPRIRPVDGLDHCKGAQRWLFITIPEDHCLADCARLTERQVRFAPCSPKPGEIIALTADFGIEIGSLAMTEEAFQAYVKRSGDLRPFAEADYLGQTDLIVPLPRLRWLYMAMPLHLYLQTGRLNYDDYHGWLWDKEVRLGQTYVDAFMALENTKHRLDGLQPLEDLMQEAEELLLAAETREGVFKILFEVEKKLSKQLVQGGMAERFLLMQQRAVTRMLLSEYRDRIKAADAYRSIWRRDHKPQTETVIHYLEPVKESKNGQPE